MTRALAEDHPPARPGDPAGGQRGCVGEGLSDGDASLGEIIVDPDERPKGASAMSLRERVQQERIGPVLLRNKTIDLGRVLSDAEARLDEWNNLAHEPVAEALLRK